jgi:uncharacterized membrane protein YraQ (UPF0718 family)
MTAINDLFTAGQFFLTIAAELVLLFIGISFLVGLIQEYVPEEKIRRALATKHALTGTALGAVFGALTPFCSCSTIPVMVGLIKSKVPFGACMAFLFASPLLNPVIVLLLLTLFGPLLTVIYCIMTFIIAVFSGIILERRGYIRYVKPVATSRETRQRAPLSGGCSCNPISAPVAPTACCAGSEARVPQPSSCGCSSIVVPDTPPPGGCSCRGEPAPAPTGTRYGDEAGLPSIHYTHIGSALRFAWSLFRQVVPYLLLGAAIGAFIYGFVPEDLIVAIAGPGNPLAIPIAAVIGIPMYIRAETIIPISAVLVAKGMGIGAVMALIIGGAGASIPEVTLLASIFERRLVAAFVVTIVGVAILTGFLFEVFQVMGVFA